MTPKRSKIVREPVFQRMHRIREISTLRKKKWRTQCCGQIFIYLMYQEMEQFRGEEQGKEDGFISRLVGVRAKITEGY